MLELLFAVVLTGAAELKELAEHVTLGDSQEHIEETIPFEGKQERYGRCDDDHGCRSVDDEDHATAMLTSWTIESQQVLFSVSYCGSKGHWASTSVEIRRLALPITDDAIIYKRELPPQEMVKRCYAKPKVI